MSQDMISLFLQYGNLLDKDGISDVHHIKVLLNYETKKGRSRGMLLEAGRDFPD
jgi:hypothetical protein